MLEPYSVWGKTYPRRKRSLLFLGLTFIDLLHSGFITTALRPIMPFVYDETPSGLCTYCIYCSAPEEQKKSKGERCMQRLLGNVPNKKFTKCDANLLGRDCVNNCFMKIRNYGNRRHYRGKLVYPSGDYQMINNIPKEIYLYYLKVKKHCTPTIPTSMNYVHA